MTYWKFWKSNIFFSDFAFDYGHNKRNRVVEEQTDSQESEEKNGEDSNEGAGGGEEGRGISTLLEVMEVNKIYFEDEEMRSTKLGKEMERFLDFVKLEHFHDRVQFLVEDGGITVTSKVDHDFLAQSDGLDNRKTLALQETLFPGWIT